MPVFQDNGAHIEQILHFSLPGLLPEDHILIVNTSIRTATLVQYEASGGTPNVTQHVFSRNGIRVFVPLLQAYPDYCPYDVLLASLFPISIDQRRMLLQKEWEVAIRPVRRAIGGIMTGLQSFGLEVISLRGLGYLLKRLSDTP